MINPRIPYRRSSERPLRQGKRILGHLAVKIEHWRFYQAMPYNLKLNDSASYATKRHWYAATEQTEA